MERQMNQLRSAIDFLDQCRREPELANAVVAMRELESAARTVLQEYDAPAPGADGRTPDGFAVDLKVAGEDDFFGGGA